MLVKKDEMLQFYIKLKYFIHVEVKVSKEVKECQSVYIKVCVGL